MRSEKELFAFTVPHGYDGICRIERIYLDDGRTVVICTELTKTPARA